MQVGEVHAPHMTIVGAQMHRGVGCTPVHQGGMHTKANWGTVGHTKIKVMYQNLQMCTWPFWHCHYYSRFRMQRSFWFLVTVLVLIIEIIGELLPLGRGIFTEILENLLLQKILLVKKHGMVKKYWKVGMQWYRVRMQGLVHMSRWSQYTHWGTEVLLPLNTWKVARVEPIVHMYISTNRRGMQGLMHVSSWSQYTNWGADLPIPRKYQE